MSGTFLLLSLETFLELNQCLPPACLFQILPYEVVILFDRPHLFNIQCYAMIKNAAIKLCYIVL